MSTEEPYHNHSLFPDTKTIIEQTKRRFDEPYAALGRFVEIITEDPGFTEIVKNAVNQYAVLIQGRGEFTANGVRLYTYDPTTDYLHGSVVAQGILVAQYEASEHGLPKIDPATEDLFIDLQLLDSSGLENLEGYPDCISGRLGISGCDEQMLVALNDPRMSLLERIGGLETMSLYGAQHSRDSDQL